MSIQKTSDPQRINRFDSLYLQNNMLTEENNRLAKTRIRIRIPKNYHQEPIISRLIPNTG